MKSLKQTITTHFLWGSLSTLNLPYDSQAAWLLFPRSPQGTSGSELAQNGWLETHVCTQNCSACSRLQGASCILLNTMGSISVISLILCQSCVPGGGRGEERGFLACRMVWRQEWASHIYSHRKQDYLAGTKNSRQTVARAEGNSVKRDWLEKVWHITCLDFLR
jgi:hypothetical protein